MNTNSQPGNILFIMCDQLRFDYLSCYGHQSLQTPNIDKLASKGVRFTHAYCSAPICAPSRASYYSGRYASSHGVLGNDDATRLDEKMIADYLQPLGYRSAVVGKTHTHKSLKEMKALGMDPTSPYCKASQTGGFEPYESHEGLYPDPVLKVSPGQGYDAYLKSLGYDAENPWEKNANSGIDSDGNLHSGWALGSSKYPAAIDEEHSETAFTTRRAMDFIRECGDQPWCLHLSYIKPHWPVIAPTPYHDMYKPVDIQSVVRNESERQNPHPVYQAFMQQEYSESYSRDEVTKIVIPTYMGLVRQIDDHLGQLFDFLEAQGLDQNTLIVFTADHGDYLGDHWLGEKDLFHDVSAKVPLIIVDPRPSADTTRGQTCEKLAEGVDILPSLVEFAGGKPCQERIEGQTLLPLLNGSPDKFHRDFAVSEIDYADRGPRALLGLKPYECRATMACDHRWKYIHHQQFKPQLFDLENDPDELTDLGSDPQHAGIRQQMRDFLFDWQGKLKRRCGLPYDYMEGQGPERDEEWGIIIGRC
jgi:arylsulfatase A-like enzyme